MIGEALGKYRIEAELSRGGMGAVYLARHEVLERQVAIKVLRPELTTNPELVTRFVNEAKAASAIRHPSIIEVFDFGTTDDGEAYLVMEYLEGETLAQRIETNGTLGEAEAVRIIRGIADALSAAHAKGIIHRDLKPDNVFLVPDPDLGERAKVLDFGVAKLAESQGNTMTGALMGTPLYMAPEQARSAGGIDHRADLYSLGCIFYELLTGKPPLVGEGAGEIIAMHMFTEPQRPSSVVASISPAVEQVVMTLLEKEPVARYASAADVADALSGVTSTTAMPPAIAPIVRVPPPSPPSARSNLPMLAAGIAIAVLGVGAVVIALVVSGDDDKPASVTAPPAQPAPTPQPAPPPEPPVEVAAPAPPAPPPQQPASEAKARPRPRPQPLPAVRHTDKRSPVETAVD